MHKPWPAEEQIAGTLSVLIFLVNSLWSMHLKVNKGSRELAIEDPGLATKRVLDLSSLDGFFYGAGWM